MSINNLEIVKKSLIEEIDKRINLKIIEETNADLIKEMIKQSETIVAAMAIAQLGTSYKKTGYYYDKRIEKIDSNIKYLRKNLDLSFISNQSGLNHKLIIGDNYEALLNLIINYKNKIDIIYIDPPYASDSIGKHAETNYNNNITRDNLLSMLEPRLRLAKQLLSNEGVIFISMDDRNQSHVKLLMDDIFGEENFICNFIRKTSVGAKTSRTNIDRHHEYLISFAKNINEVNFMGEKKELNDYSNPDNDPNGDWTKDTLTIKIDKGRTAINARYPIYNPYLKITHYPPIVDLTGNKQWHYTEKVFKEKLENGQVVFYKDNNFKGKYSFYIKKYKKDIKKDNSNVSTLFSINGMTNGNGTNDLKKIILNSNFDAPKPVEFIKKIIQYNSKKDSIILDFFAGSGTTGQAVMELNLEDEGERKFILCTNNEKDELKHPNGIAYDITTKRLKRIMDGKCYDDSSNFEWLKENYPFADNLEVYEIEKINNRDKAIFNKIDEKNYGMIFNSIQDKIKWICENFENTQKILGEEE